MDYLYYLIKYWIDDFIKLAIIFFIILFFYKRFVTDKQYKRLARRIENIEQFIKENFNLDTIKIISESKQESKEELSKQLSPEETSKKEISMQINEESMSEQFLLLIDFIKKQIIKGISKEFLKNKLLQYGWNESEIEKAYSLATIQIQNSVSKFTTNQEKVLKQYNSFINYLKEDWILKLGALLLLIGFGWFIRYAFLHDWIGKQGRIAFGLIVGTLIMFWGWHRIKNYINQGSVLLVLGSTIILMTIFAARMIYDFFTPSSALMLMFLSTAFVALASVKYRNERLSVLSLLLAAIAPLLTNAPEPNAIGLFSYLLAIILGASWIVLITGHRSLISFALLIVFIYSLPYLLSDSFQSLSNINLLQKLLLFAYGFGSLFFLVSIMGFLRFKDKPNLYDLITAAGNGLFLLSWIQKVVAPEWKVLIISAWTIVFALGAFFIFKLTRRQGLFYIYAGVSCLFLAIATYIQLATSLGILTIAYTIESGIIIILTYLLFKDISLTMKISWIFIGPVLLSFENIFAIQWKYLVIHEHFFALLVLALTFIGLGLFFHGRLQSIDNKN